MSCALVWKPIYKKSYRVGDIKLREIIDKKYGYPCTLDASDIHYLEALQDADVDGAEDLIEAIIKHEEIRLELEC